MPAAKSRTVNEIIHTGYGAISRQPIRISIKPGSPNTGILFELTNGGIGVQVAALAQNVVHTVRNVVLGIGKQRLCLVEHFLAAASLWGLNDLIVTVDGPELPLGDGSASFWFDQFEKAGWKRSVLPSIITLPEPITCKQNDRMLIALPDDTFSVTYLMDWDHPLIGKCWQSWNLNQDINDIATARTFGLEKENQLLGVMESSISLKSNGFSQPLRFKDEPVRHKLLDLVGDLTLIGFNPLSLKARFISIKGGHELDVMMARRLSEMRLKP